MLASSHHQKVTDLIGSDLTFGDQICFLVTSNSMLPLIKIGDTVVAEVISGDRVERGDIIIVKRSDDFLTHRVISLTKDGWLTKGDRNSLPDPPVKPDSIIGRVKTIQRAHQTIDLDAHKWRVINPMLAKLGELEMLAFSYHRYLRLPFRIMIRIVHKLSTM